MSVTSKLSLFSFIIISAILGYTLYLQFFGNFVPCPLCILQRTAMMILDLFFLLLFLHRPQITGRRIYAVLIILFSLIGAAIATRHIFLQHLPPSQVTACDPGLDYMIETLPIGEVVKRIFEGSAECGIIQWQFLGLTMAQWSCIWFIIFALVGIRLLSRHK